MYGAESALSVTPSSTRGLAKPGTACSSSAADIASITARAKPRSAPSGACAPNAAGRGEHEDRDEAAGVDDAVRLGEEQRRREGQHPQATAACGEVETRGAHKAAIATASRANTTSTGGGGSVSTR